MPVSETFWNEQREELFRVLYPLIREAAMTSAKYWHDDLIASTGVGVDWALINTAAVKWARDYSYELVKGINATSRNAVAQAVSDWANSTLPLQDLIDSLTPLYGPVRAELIASTESTRAFMQGSIITWQESGVVNAWRYNNAEDDLTCPICAPQAGIEYALDDDTYQPPLHPRCRCWGQPVVRVAETS